MFFLFLTMFIKTQITSKNQSHNFKRTNERQTLSKYVSNLGSQTKFLYWEKLVDSVTRLQLPAGLVIPVNQLSRNLSHL